MSGQILTVGNAVITEMVRLAAQEVPGVLRVGRAGPLWRRLFHQPAVEARVRGGRVTVRLALIARPGQPLQSLGLQVRSAVTAAVERLLALELESVTVIVDGVGD